MDRQHTTRRAAMLDHEADLASAINFAVSLLAEAGAAHSPPQKYETAGPGGGDGFRAKSETEFPVFEQPYAQHKRVATLTARAAPLCLVLRQDDGASCITQESGAGIPLASLHAAAAPVRGCEQVRAKNGATASRLMRVQGAQT